MGQCLRSGKPSMPDHSTRKPALEDPPPKVGEVESFLLGGLLLPSLGNL